MNTRIILLHVIIFIWSGLVFAGGERDYELVDTKSIVKKCHNLYSDALGERAYTPVNECLKKEIMNQAYIIMGSTAMEFPIKSHRFESILIKYINVLPELYGAIYDRCVNCADIEKKEIFVQREIEKGLVRILSRMIARRNEFKIGKYSRERY